MSGPSIKAALSGKETTENNISVQEQFEIFSRSKENELFTEEMLLKKWGDLLETLNDRPNLKSTINQKPQLTENNTVLLKIDNLVQEELIRNNKPQLVAWLRKELRNATIDLATEFTKEPARRIIYTDDEKFDEMVRKNSALSLLKEKFHLDFDN
jgi:DNA polymerase III subunit gamma/tau